MQQSLRNALISLSVRNKIFSENMELKKKNQRHAKFVFQWNIHCEMWFQYY